MSARLIGCPICAAVPAMDRIVGKWTVWCHLGNRNHNVEVYAATEDAAIDAWNTRAAPLELATLRAEWDAARGDLMAVIDDLAQDLGCASDNEAVLASVSTLRAEVERLRGALEPFARYSATFPSADANAPLTVFVSNIPRMGDCHAAAAALATRTGEDGA